MNYDTVLQKQIDKASTDRYLTTKAELIEYYRENTPKGLSWKQAITRDLADITGMKQKSLEKRFEKRIDNPERRNASQYAELGKLHGAIGKQAPKGGFQVYWVIGIQISGKKNNVREQTQNITGSMAHAFANGEASWKPLMDMYFNGSLAENINRVYELEVRPL